MDMNLRSSLENGAEIIQRYRLDEDGEPWMVLAYYKYEYVTWRVDSRGHASDGRYFKNYHDASANLCERIQSQIESYDLLR